jgi:tRNA pseudouridine55 synthase
MEGVLVIDKPVGPTSHDVVAAARRILREKRIGHTGTLDPLASGVLPLVIGRATRLASLLSGSDKQYEAGIRLGAATTTYDAAERVADGVPPPPAPSITRAEIAAALDGFRGEQRQVPPPYSAKKVGGVRAYALARTDRPLELKPVTVTVKELDILDFADGLLTLRVTATAGFYVRSLAHDLGQRLGCGAHLETLRRTRAAGFGLEEAITLDGLQQHPEAGLERVVPMGRVALDLPAAHLTDAGRIRASHGNALSPSDWSGPIEGARASAGVRVRLIDRDGGLVGLATVGPDGLLRPSVVLV